jgi:hypothetical protein
MIRAYLACALLGSALAFGSSAISRVQGQTDPMGAFWARFRAAVINGDKETVARLSRFPISRGYGMTSLKNKAQFMRRYREVFFAETEAAKCFPKATPVIDKERPQEFTISCPFAREGGNEEPFVYTFTRTRTGWKFTGFENINE